jgi:cell division protein FtsB
MLHSVAVTRYHPAPVWSLRKSYGMMMPFFRGRMGKLTLLLLALLVWLQYSLWFGKNGLHDYSRVSEDVGAQQATNAKLKARNDQLFAEIDDLNGGQEAIEERARNELTMTKPGETFYRLVPDASKRNQGSVQNTQNNR